MFGAVDYHGSGAVSGGAMAKGPGPPGASGPTKQVRVTVLGGEVLPGAAWATKAEPYIDVALLARDGPHDAGRHVGHTPPDTHGGVRHVWEHTMQVVQFDVGDRLSFRVMGKMRWPRTDVHFGSGSLELTGDLAAEGSGDFTVRLSGGAGREALGDLHVALAFSTQDSGAQEDAAEHEGSPAALGSELVPISAAAQSRGNRTSEPRGGSVSETLGRRRNKIARSGSGTPTPQPPENEADRESIVVTRRMLWNYQYWARAPARRRGPVYCTSGVRRWLAREWCLICLLPGSPDPELEVQRAGPRRQPS